MRKGGQSSLFQGKTCHVGTDVSAKPVCSAAPELGSYVLFSPLFLQHTHTDCLAPSLPICLTLTLQLWCLIRVIFNLPSAETSCTAMPLFSRIAMHTGGGKKTNDEDILHDQNCLCSVRSCIGFIPWSEGFSRMKSEKAFRLSISLFTAFSVQSSESASNLQYHTPTVSHNAATRLTHSYCSSLSLLYSQIDTNPSNNLESIHTGLNGFHSDCGPVLLMWTRVWKARRLSCI